MHRHLKLVHLLFHSIIWFCCRYRFGLKVCKTANRSNLKCRNRSSHLGSEGYVSLASITGRGIEIPAVTSCNALLCLNGCQTHIRVANSGWEIPGDLEEVWEREGGWESSAGMWCHKVYPQKLPFFWRGTDLSNQEIIQLQTPNGGRQARCESRAQLMYQHKDMVQEDRQYPL